MKNISENLLSIIKSCGVRTTFWILNILKKFIKIGKEHTRIYVP